MTTFRAYLCYTTRTKKTNLILCKDEQLNGLLVLFTSLTFTFRTEKFCITISKTPEDGQVVVVVVVVAPVVAVVFIILHCSCL